MLAWGRGRALTAFAWWYVLSDVLRVLPPTSSNTDLLRGADFRDATYFPVKEFVSGGDPYDPARMFGHWPVGQEFDLYAPIHLRLQLPLALLDYRTTFIVFSCVGLVYLWALGVACARLVDLPGGWAAAAGAVLSLLAIGKEAIFSGQINTLVGLDDRFQGVSGRMRARIA